MRKFDEPPGIRSLIIALMNPPPVPSLRSQTCSASAEMVLSSDTDLITLMQCVPPLLHACVNNSCVAYEGARTDFKAFRLVSKEARRLALTAITTCTLSLTGQASDTSMDIVGLLCEAKLETLHVNLLLTGECCSKIMSIAEQWVYHPDKASTE